MDAPTPDETRYWVDADDRLVRVCDAWDRFARSNGGDAATAAEVCGRSLREFIADDRTRMWVDALLLLARTRNGVVQRAYRCDSPDEKRYMRMRIEPKADRSACVSHRIERIEPIEPAVPLVMAPTASSELTLRCSICNRLEVEGHWQDVDSAAVVRLEPLRVAHTVCRRCWGTVRGAPRPSESPLSGRRPSDH